VTNSPKFSLEFEPGYGTPVEVAPAVFRLTVNNPSPFTFYGTNSYIIGTKALAVIDPGPEDEGHFQALLAAIGGRPVSHIFLTHTHIDHSPLAARLKHATGALTAAEGPHRSARPLRIGEINPLDASGDVAFQPDLLLRDGEVTAGDGWALSAVTTPGHAANHLVFALEGRRRTAP
jgi:glyoxylase-like metal-dependent hydrolase (beta-lactamase superfamily II)